MQQLLPLWRWKKRELVFSKYIDIRLWKQWTHTQLQWLPRWGTVMMLRQIMAAEAVRVCSKFNTYKGFKNPVLIQKGTGFLFALNWDQKVDLLKIEIIGRWQSGQMRVVVTHLSHEYGGSNPSRPTRNDLWRIGVIIMGRKLSFPNWGWVNYCACWGSL